MVHSAFYKGASAIAFSNCDKSSRFVVVLHTSIGMLRINLLSAMLLIRCQLHRLRLLHLRSGLGLGFGFEFGLAISGELHLLLWLRVRVRVRVRARASVRVRAIIRVRMRVRIRVRVRIKVFRLLLWLLRLFLRLSAALSFCRGHCGFRRGHSLREALLHVFLSLFERLLRVNA